MKNSKTIKTIVYHVCTFLFGIVMVYPIVWMILSSFKESSAVISDAIRLFPRGEWQFSNYPNGWKGFSDGAATFYDFFKNSFIIASVSTLGTGVCSCMAAYSFSVLHFKGRQIWFICMMVTLMLPAQVLLIPQYILFNNLGMLGTKLPMILPTFLGLSFFIFMVMQFISGLPEELYAAAKIDGCSLYMIFWRIVVPLLKPAFVTITIFSFYWRWDDFFSPLLYTTREKDYTVSVALKIFADPEGIDKWGPMFAMATLSIIPILIIFFTCQKYIVEGISTTGLKA